MTRCGIVIALLAMCACRGAEENKSFRLHAMATNKTDVKFTDVSVNGQGYPGTFGNVVPGSRKSITYAATEIDETFEVIWRHGAELHRVTLDRPAEFTLAGEQTLVVEFDFEAEANVRAYAQPVPW